MGVLGLAFLGAVVIAFQILTMDARAARIDSQERVDRLIESLAHHSGIDLHMPAPAAPEKLISVPGWWDKKPHVWPNLTNKEGTNGK
jgi:hypothetical protein